MRPLRITSQIDPETSFDRKRKVEGLEINNQRISAEIKKEQEMISLSGKYLGPKDIPDRLLKGVDLSSEANTQLQIHDRLKDDRNSYPDVYIPRELAVDHAIYEQALREEQQDRAIFLERLKKRTAALNLEIQYDSKTGEVTIDRSPQSEDTQATGGASR